MIAVESESLYSKSTHFDSALAADLPEKSFRIFSSHVGAITSAGHLWGHKPNLQQNDLKQFLKWEQNLTLVCQKGDNLTTRLKI